MTCRARALPRNHEVVANRSRRAKEVSGAVQICSERAQKGRKTHKKKAMHMSAPPRPQVIANPAQGEAKRTNSRRRRSALTALLWSRQSRNQAQRANGQEQQRNNSHSVCFGLMSVFADGMHGHPCFFFIFGAEAQLLSTLEPLCAPKKKTFSSCSPVTSS